MYFDANQDSLDFQVDDAIAHVSPSGDDEDEVFDEDDTASASAAHLADDEVDEDELESTGSVATATEDEDEDDDMAITAPKPESTYLPKDDDTVRVREKFQTETVDAEGKPKRAPRKRWYIVHTYSGHENKVKVNLERRIESMNMADKIFRVEVPQKSVTKIKDNRRYEREERVFPGYVLVEMIMDDDSWYVVRHTPGVTKFVGSQKRPIPAKDVEIRRILMREQQAGGRPVAAKIEIDLKVGEIVKIISGPFADFEGSVTEISPEKERIKASVIIFGRETPVELAFNQVQKTS